MGVLTSTLRMLRILLVPATPAELNYQIGLSSQLLLRLKTPSGISITVSAVTQLRVPKIIWLKIYFEKGAHFYEVKNKMSQCTNFFEVLSRTNSAVPLKKISFEKNSDQNWGVACGRSIGTIG